MSMAKTHIGTEAVSSNEEISTDPARIFTEQLCLYYKVGKRHGQEGGDEIKNNSSGFFW